MEWLQEWWDILRFCYAWYVHVDFSASNNRCVLAYGNAVPTNQLLPMKVLLRGPCSIEQESEDVRGQRKTVKPSPYLRHSG